MKKNSPLFLNFDRPHTLIYPSHGLMYEFDSFPKYQSLQKRANIHSNSLIKEHLHPRKLKFGLDYLFCKHLADI